MSLTTDDDHVLVRMYNVGFGDAFVLVLPGQDGPRRVLVDCGSHASSARPRPIKEVVAQIVEDVRDDDGVPRIDVVVATHRHQDHVSGFDSPAWGEVEVREVWMPWTENPHDPEATRIRDAQSAAAKRLTLALEMIGADEDLLGLAQNQLTNAAAMKTLHEGFAGSPERRFLPTEDDPWGTVGVPGAPGVTVQVLGPSRDAEIIRDMDPPAGESYLRMAGAADPDDARSAPFPAKWSRTADEMAAAQDDGWPILTPDEQEKVDALADADLFAVAVQLEKAVNGTSLMLMFHVGKAYMLFPGDAQWGTWLRVLERPEAADVIRRTTFYKVGHHGSHNATPRRFVTLLGDRAGAGGHVDDLTAMVSTHTMSRWKYIPKRELMQALGALTPRLARSDEGSGPAPGGFDHWDDLFIDFRVPVS